MDGTPARHLQPNEDPQPVPAESRQETSVEGHESSSVRALSSPLPNHGLPAAPELSLLDLVRLTKLQQHHYRRCLQLQRQLHLAQVTAARTARLLLAIPSIQRTLAECIKSEDKHSFVNLFNAFHDALPDAPNPPGLVDGDVHGGSGITPSFLDALPAQSRRPLLDLIAKVKTDPSFVADRLAALSHKDLIGLLREKGRSSRFDDSIFASPQKANARSSKYLGYVVDGQTELLSSCDLASPLSVLIHSVRGLAPTSLQNDGVATRVWSIACARLISEQRPGSEKLVPTVISAWATSSEWPGRERLELCLSRILQQGSFLLEQPRRQSFVLGAQGGPIPASPDEDTQREQFYSDAVDSVLRLLTDPEGSSIIPPGALSLCAAIHAELQQSPVHQRAFPNFAITRWLFPSFLLDAITLPEAHGMLTDFFISEHARQRVLREVASRCHKAALDVIYSWRLGSTPTDQTTSLMRGLAERIRGSGGLPDIALQDFPNQAGESTVLAISASDIQTMVSALYPTSALPSATDRDSMPTGMRSSASSISGFSLFQTIGPAETPNPDSQRSSREFNTEQWPSCTPGSSPGDPLAVNIATVQAESEGEQLREVCATLDDILSRRRPLALDQWSVLLHCNNNHQICTIHDRHSEFLNAAGGDALFDDIPTLHRSCRNIITDLLATRHPELLSVSATYSKEPGTTIMRALKNRIRRLEESMDLVQAHSYSCKLRQIRQLMEEAKGDDAIVSLLDGIGAEKQLALDAALSITESCHALSRAVQSALELHSPELLRQMETIRRLRDKMWYIAELKTSAPYDDLRAVASALKAMGKAQKPPRTRLAPSLRTSNGNKVSITNLHLKSETQVLDVLTASPSHGGRRKLGDDQSKALAIWMETNGIQNLCTGEERIHKLGMEIRRVVEVAITESSTLLASDLFANDQPSPHSTSTSGYPIVTDNGGRLDLLSLYTSRPESLGATSSASSNARSTTSSKDYLDYGSPSTTHHSSVWSPVMTEARSSSSITSVDSAQTQSATAFQTKSPTSFADARRCHTFESLRQDTTSLLISDIANMVFIDGSETDVACFTGLSGQLSERHLRDVLANSDLEQTTPDEASDFNFENAFESLLCRFDATANPYSKLRLLQDIDTLLEPCTRSMSTWQSEIPTQFPPGKSVSQLPNPKMLGFRRLFCNKATRPAGIFRDLQYIAAVVPSRWLETSSQGRAFQHAADAMGSLRDGIYETLVNSADGIIAHHANKRRHGRSSSAAQQERDSRAFSVPNRSPSPEDVSGRSMADAALLLQITAKSGHPVAQRELATLYLTHPELMDHILAPLSRPRDVFKEELESKWRKNQDPTRCDPTTMCVAHHWMSLSSRGGDALATKYLRQREEMERLP